MKNFDPTKRGLSRRELFRRLGLGIAGGAIATVLAKKPANAAPIALSSSGTGPVFDVLVDPSGKTTVLGETAYLNGKLFVRTSTQALTGAYEDIQCFDVQSNQFVFSLRNFLPAQQLPATPFIAPVSDGTLIYTANQNIIYNIDANGSALEMWMVDASVASNLLLVSQNQDVVFLDASGGLNCYNISAQQAKWSLPNLLGLLPSGALATVTADGNIIYVIAPQAAGQPGIAAAVNLSTGTRIFASAIQLGTGGTVGAGKVFFTTRDNKLVAMDPTTGSTLWQYPPSNALSGPLLPPVAWNNQVLLVDNTGILHAVDQTAGTLTWQAGLNQPPTSGSRIMVEDCIAYLSLGLASGPAIYGLDLTTRQAASYATDSPATFIGVENGVCYFAHQSGKNLAGRSFTGDLHGLFSESVLIEDFVPAGGTTNRTPTYRTHLLFLDSNYNPRPFKAVKIWSSDPAQIINGASTYQVNPTTGVWLTTDGSGELSIVVSPDNVTCPALYVWDSYMLPGDAMVIYPDWDTTNSLATLQSSNMPDNNPFDGTPLFAGVTGKEALAASIRYTIGGGSQQQAVQQKQAQLARRRKGKVGATASLTASESYIAYPNSTPNMAFALGYASTDPSRPYSPGAGNPLTWTLTLNNGNCSIAETTASPLLGSGIHIHWRDLVSKVVQGAEKVISVVAQVGSDITHTITTVAEAVQNVYTLVIDSVEAAAAVVASVLKTVVGDIVAVVKWLAYLFDWKDILATQQLIVQTVTERATNFVTWLNQTNQSGSVKSQIHAGFQQAETGVVNALNSIIAQIGGQTVQSQQSNNNNPQAVYGMKGAKSYSQSKWLSTKIQANVGQTQAVTTGVGAADPLSGIYTAMEAFIGAAGSVLKSANFSSIPTDLEALIRNFGNLATNPSTFITHTFGDILSLFRDIAVSMLQMTDALVEGFSAALPTVLQGAVALITAPISIPVIDDVFRLIGGGQLTMLNLLALAVAIPATIVNRVVSVGSKLVGGAEETVFALIEAFGGLGGMAFDVWSDSGYMPSSGWAPIAALAVSAITFFCGAPFDAPPQYAWEVILYMMETGGMTLALTGLALSKYAPEAGNLLWSQASPIVTAGYGAIMEMLLVLQALSDSNWAGLTLIANIFTWIPYIGRAFAVGPKITVDTPQRLLPCLVDYVGDMTATVAVVLSIAS